MIHGGVEFPWWRAEYLQEVLPRQVEDPEVHGDAALDVRDWGRLRSLQGGGRAAAEATLGLTMAEILERSRAARSTVAPAKEVPRWVETAERWVRRADRYELPIESLDLLEVVRPVLAGAHAEAFDGLMHLLPDLDDDVRSASTHVVHAALQSLPIETVSQAVTRLSVLEMHLSRERGELTGEDGGGRYAQFVEILRSPETQGTLWAKYPVVVRFLVDRLENWVAMVLEFFERLVNDYDRLCQHGMVTRGAELRATFATGDAHNMGRAVIILREGDDAGVVYKPRSADIDLAFSSFVRLVNQSDARADLQLPRVMERGSYSWHEFIAAQPAVGDQENRDLAYRLGVLNAMILALSGNDFHHENILVKGPHPVPIDFETVSHPETRAAVQKFDDYLDFSAQAVRESGANIGILPGKIVSQGEDETVASDISVLGFRPGQRSAMRMPTVQDFGTDQMRFVQDYPSQEAFDEGYTSHEAIRYGEDFIAGFAGTLGRLAEERGVLAQPGGPIFDFAEAHMRYIARPTMIYGRVLMESLHPDFLTTGPRREMVLAKLCTGFEGRPTMVDLRRQEKAALLVGDIPYFSRPASECSWLDDGGPSLFEHLVAAVRTRLTPSRVDYEVSVAELSLAAAQEPVRTHISLRGEEDGQVLDELVMKLRRMALLGSGHDDVGFATMMPIGTEHWVVKAAGMDAYSGLTGIYLALQSLTEVDAEAQDLIDRLRASVMARRTVAHQALSRAEELGEVLGTGAYSELGGYLLALGEIYRRSSLEERRGLQADLSAALRASHALALRSRSHDVVGGTAGLILVLLTLPEEALAGDGENILRDLARSLVERADVVGPGLAWRDPELGVHLLGFSHGAAGIAVALLAAGDRLGDPAITAAGKAALLYDDSMMDESGDWPDLREQTHDGERQSMRAWCHGSPGALLARAMAWPYLDEPERERISQQVDAALPGILQSIDPATIAQGNVSLCHGTLGNLVIVDYLCETGLAGQEAAEMVEVGLAALLDAAQSPGWALGALPGAHVPDLMMGLSGVVWGLGWLTGRCDKQSVHLLAVGPRAMQGGREERKEAACLSA